MYISEKMLLLKKYKLILNDEASSIILWVYVH